MSNAYPRFGLKDDQLAAIGSVCVAWGMLDYHTGQLATYLYTAPYTDDVGIISGTVGFKDRLDLIRALAHNKIANRQAFGDLARIIHEAV